MAAEIRLGGRKFYDDEHFPGGIDRAGFFTIPEANFLINYGYTLNGLYCGELQPENEVEQRFVDNVNSEEESAYYEVRIWRKYLKALYKVSHRASANSSRNEITRSFESFDEA
ncbi:DUF413 domain-containing protein [Pseudoalteromonas sp. SSM20]|uniref:DUF413 domain-containing protein n=1 Tax=Pseudoalteromonas sp. SSM20 TaxID=3139394 RepID=UPI003BAC2D23